MNDYVEVHTNGGTRRFVEGEGEWWVLGGPFHSWELVKDSEHGFLVSFNPPGRPSTELGSVFVTAHGRRLVLASITVKGPDLRVMLMPGT
jgi:hypothetical protein